MRLSSFSSAILALECFLLLLSLESVAAEVAHKEEVRQAAVHLVRDYALDEKDIGPDLELLLKSQFSEEAYGDIVAEGVQLAAEAYDEDDDAEYEEADDDEGPEDANGKYFYADRFVEGMQETINDPDCMEREFDLSGNGYMPSEISDVLFKCKLVVLRNVFDKEYLEDFRQRFTQYLWDIKQNRTSAEGITTNGEEYYYHQIDHKRFEVILTEKLADPELIARREILNILADQRLLTEHLTLHSLGTALAESGANGQAWHQDDEYVYTDSLFPFTGRGGHDLPAWAVTMMVPMLNMTHEHGPTEFCMGSSYTAGWEKGEHGFRNSTKEKLFKRYDKYHRARTCPMEYWRQPMLNFGDMLLFDYQLMHRGGQNISPDLRAVLYMTYSRRWYKDTNFRKAQKNSRRKHWILQQLLANTRLALPRKEAKRKKDEFVPGEERLENMGEFLPSNRNNDGEQKAQFLLSNKDVEGELTVFVNDEEAGKLGLGADGSRMMRVDVGSQLSVQNSAGLVIKEWTLIARQVQLVLCQHNLKRNG